MPASAILGPALAAWLSVLFISAAAAKLVSTDIIDSLAGYRTLLSGRILRPVALALPVVELTTGVLILRGDRLGGIVAAILGLTFTVLAAAVLHRGLVVSCGCAGHGRTRVSGVTAARGIVITAGGLYLLGAPAGIGSRGAALAAIMACIPAAGIVASRIRQAIDGRRTVARRKIRRTEIEAEFARRLQ